jgi:hypothetical protein
MFRIISNIFIIFSLFILPIYVTIFAIIYFIFKQENFIEAIIFGYLIDFIYGSGTIFTIHFAYFFTLFISIIYLVSFKLKTILR